MDSNKYLKTPYLKAAQRAGDIPQQRITRRKFNFRVMTDGEFRAALLLQDLQLMKAWNGDPQRLFQQGIDLINDVMGLGLHTGYKAGQLRTYFPKELSYLVRELNAAHKKIRPASAYMPLSRDPSKLALRGYEIPLFDCGNHPSPHVFDTTSQYNAALSVYQACQDDNDFVDLLNENFPDSAHHIMYEYETASSTNLPPDVASKRVDHKTAIDGLSGLTGLSRSNIALWGDLGIKQSNIQDQSIGDLDGQESVDVMRIALSQEGHPGIGDPVSTVAAITAIVGLLGKIFASLAKGKALKNMFTAEEQTQASIYKLGLAHFGANMDDWPYPWGTGSNTNTDGDGGNNNNDDDDDSKSKTDFVKFGMLGVGAWLLLSGDNQKSK